MKGTFFLLKQIIASVFSWSQEEGVPYIRNLICYWLLFAAIKTCFYGSVSKCIRSRIEVIFRMIHTWSMLFACEPYRSWWPEFYFELPPGDNIYVTYKCPSRRGSSSRYHLWVSKIKVSRTEQPMVSWYLSRWSYLSTEESDSFPTGRANRVCMIRRMDELTNLIQLVDITTRLWCSFWNDWTRHVLSSGTGFSRGITSSLLLSMQTFYREAHMITFL